MNRQVLRMLLRPAPGERAVLALPVIAFGVVTALVLTVIGGAQSFWRWTDADAGLYQALAAIALVLLLVPLFTLGGAAARLSARRRDERLSTLRLLGVTPGGVVAATVIESTLIAGAGALAGVVGHVLLAPAVGMIRFRGEPLGVLAVLVDPASVIGVVCLVLVLAAVSAAVGMRRVIVSPLGVRTRDQVPGVHWVRPLIAVGVIGLAYIAVTALPASADMGLTIIVLAGMFAAALGVLNVIGPWILKIQGRLRLRFAQGPERLLSARQVLESPKAAWRQVGSIAMTSFMAVFAGVGVALVDTTSGHEADANRMLATDVQTGLIITLIGSFLMVAVSVGVNQASAVLDQRELHQSLHRLGVPLDTVDSARRSSVMSPLLMTSLGSAACAAILVLPLTGAVLLLAPTSLLTIAGVLALGIGLVWFSTRTTRPLLERAFTAV